MPFHITGPGKAYAGAVWVDIAEATLSRMMDKTD